MSVDASIRVTDTNSATEFHGSVLGIETPLFRWVAGSLIISFILFAWLHYGCAMTLSKAGLIAVVPPVFTAAFLVLFCQGKPPGYAGDLLESAVNRGNASPIETQPLEVAFNPLPDCYLAGGIIFQSGPRRDSCASRGFWVEPPVLHNASNSERNRMQETIRQIFRVLPSAYSLQVSWWVDSDYSVALRRYQAQTQRTSNTLVKRTRNLHFLWHWEQMRQRQHRRERVAIFLCRTLDNLPAAGLRQALAEGAYDENMRQLQIEFTEVEKQVASLLTPQGGRVLSMDDADHYRLFTRKLNPSFAERVGYDPAEILEPVQPLFENCWNGELRGLGARGFFLDDYYHGVLLLKRWPSQTYPTLIHKLTQVPCGDYDITVHLERLPVDQVVLDEQKEQDRISQQLASKHDERLVVSMNKKRQRIQRLSEGSLLAMMAEFIIVVRAKNPEALSERMLALKSAINGLNGAQYLEATLPASARNAFFKTLPGLARSGGLGLRLFGEDSFVADMIPLSSSFTGHLESADAIYGGTHGNLVGIKNFSKEGGQATPVNMIVMGATGVGKSLQTQNALQQSQPDIHYTVIIEEGLSHADYTRSFGVQPIEFRLDGGTQTINCFDSRGMPMTSFQRASITAALARMVGLPADEDRARQRQAVIGKYVARLCSEHAEDKLRGLSEQKRLQLVREALAVQCRGQEQGLTQLEALSDFRNWRTTAPEKAAAYLAKFSDEQTREFEMTFPQVVRDFVFCHLAADDHLTLSSLREFFEINGEGAEAEECRCLATMVAPWCRGGNYGNLFDGPSTISMTGPVVHFELSAIPEAAREIKVLVGFLLINDLRQHLLSIPRQLLKRVIVEEMSRFLDVPGGEKILRELFEQFRKYTVQIVVVVQQYSRIADTPIRAALVGNTRAFVIFNTGDRQDIERLAKDIGLSAVAQEAILRYPRPDQQTGQKSSEFCYFHTDPRQPICGTVRYVHLTEVPNANSENNHA